jgi:hypothetical protein
MRTGLYVAYAHERLVGGRLVEPGETITIDFSGGPQRGDAGPKDFWVIFNERDAYVARWRHGEDPGDSIWIMENEKGYERAWEVARTATGIRPATRQEVLKWLRGPSQRRSIRRSLSDRQPDYADRADEKRHPIRGRFSDSPSSPWASGAGGGQDSSRHGDFTQELPRKLLPTRAKARRSRRRKKR